MEIWEFTADRWGERQADHDLDQLALRLSTLSPSAAGARPRPEVGPGVHSASIRKHVAFFRIHGEEVRVLRVLHGSMDPLLHPFPGIEPLQ